MNVFMNSEKEKPANQKSTKASMNLSISFKWKLIRRYLQSDDSGNDPEVQENTILVRTLFRMLEEAEERCMYSFDGYWSGTFNSLWEN